MNARSLNIQNFKNLSDTSLWNLFLNGDKQAFEYIYFKLVQDLFNYGITICPDKDLLKDVIQDLFLEIWNRRQNLSSTNNIKFYLFKALKYKLHHALKNKNKNDQITSGTVESEWEISIEQSLIEEQLTQEKKERLFRSYQKLPARQRQVLNLLYFENLSYEQVSELMDINVSSVYTLTWKAISSLKKYLSVLMLMFLNI